MGVDLTFETVAERWMAAGGKDTSGILAWFRQPVVERWVESEISAVDVGELRFIGGDGGGRWSTLTGGSNRVGDLQGIDAEPAFCWVPDWQLVAVCDPESGKRVLIDGNDRACQLQVAVRAGVIAPTAKVGLITGYLNMGVVRIGKAVSPLWL